MQVLGFLDISGLTTSSSTILGEQDSIGNRKNQPRVMTMARKDWAPQAGLSVCSPGRYRDFFIYFDSWKELRDLISLPRNKLHEDGRTEQGKLFVTKDRDIQYEAMMRVFQGLGIDLKS
jgi:hypothetical protein